MDAEFKSGSEKILHLLRCSIHGLVISYEGVNGEQVPTIFINPSSQDYIKARHLHDHPGEECVFTEVKLSELTK
jgi:hypothetical protein